MFFSPRTQGKIILVLEIQSSIARSSLVWYRAGQPTHVLFVDEHAIPFKPNVGTPYFIKMTLRALSLAIDSATKNLHTISHDPKNVGVPRSIEEVHYVLSSPWVASQARTLSLNFDKATTISHDKISDILKGEREKLVPNAEGPLETIEEKIFDVRLNGYSMSSWEGKQAKQLEVAYVVTVGGADSTKRFRDACDNIVRSSKVHFHSSLLLQYVGVRTAMPERTTYTLVHIHGELTDVLAVRNGSCIFFGSFPTGVNTIIRKIARATKTDIQTADSLLSLYIGDKLDATHAKEVEPIMNDMATGWSSELKKLFKDTALEGNTNHSGIVTSRTHDDFFARSFKSVYPDGTVEAWSSNEIMPDVAFGPAARKLRTMSTYAVAIGELVQHRD